MAEETLHLDLDYAIPFSDVLPAGPFKAMSFVKAMRCVVRLHDMQSHNIRTHRFSPREHGGDECVSPAGSPE